MNPLLYSFMPTHVQVSIIMPMRNAADFIEATLRSLLVERDISIEIIVVDDLSTDDSVDKIKALQDSRVCIVQGMGKGISAALNLALAAAQGEVIMRCDADDLYPPERIKAQWDWLVAHQEYGALCGAFCTIDSQGVHIGDMGTGNDAVDVTDELLAGATRTHFSTFAVRKHVLEQINGFRPFFVTAEDIDASLRISNVCKVMYLPFNCYHYRLHKDSITHRQSNSKRIFYEETARLFQVQRVQGGLDDLSLQNPPSPPSLNDKAGHVIDQVQNLLIGEAWFLHENGKKREAINVIWRCFRHHPIKFNYRSALALLIKPCRR